MPAVLYVSSNELVSGGENVLLRVMNANREYRPVLLAPDGPLAGKACGLGIEVVKSGRVRRLMRNDSPLWPLAFPLRWPLGVLAVARAARRSGARIIHCNSLGAAVLALPAAALTGARLVYTQHLIDEGRLDRFVSRAVSRYCDRVVAVSKAVEENLVGRGIRPGKIVTVHNGLDLESEFNPELVSKGYLRERYSLPGGCRVVGIVGMLTPWKGQYVFLDAAAKLAAAHPDAVFFIIGETWDRWGKAYEKRLKDKAAELGLGDRVVFTGFIEDMPPVYRDMDVSVNASLAPEALCSVNIEAMAMGCVTVTVGTGGTSEAVRDGREGFFVEPGDPDALARTLGRILGDPDGFAQMREAARARALEKFGIDDQVNGYNRMYGEVLKATERRDPAAPAETSRGRV